jgi:hypothetical protein
MPMRPFLASRAGDGPQCPLPTQELRSSWLGPPSWEKPSLLQPKGDTTLLRTVVIFLGKSRRQEARRRKQEAVG